MPRPDNVLFAQRQATILQEVAQSGIEHAAGIFSVHRATVYRMLRRSEDKVFDAWARMRTLQQAEELAALRQEHTLLRAEFALQQYYKNKQ